MTLILTLDEQRRVEVPHVVLQGLVAEFSPGESQEIWGLVGSHGQLQLLPANSELARIRELYKKAPGRLSYDTAGSSAAMTQRSLNAFIPITCRARTRGSRFRLTLPSPLFDLELFRVEDKIVVFSQDELVEIWNHRSWNELTRTSDIKGLLRAASRLVDNDDAAK